MQGGLNQHWETKARQAIEEALDTLEPRTTAYQRLEAQYNKALADNADLLEVIRGLRLDIETYTSTLEGLQQRVDKLQRLGFGVI
jgi:Fic family protein